MVELTLTIEYGKNTGLIISPTELMNNYLFGIPTCAANGKRLPMQSVLQQITAAQARAENLFSLKLLKTLIRESRDFIREEWNAWGYVRTMYPIAFIERLDGYINDVVQVHYPRQWLSIKRVENVAMYRNVSLVPNTASAEGARMTNHSAIFQGITPHLGWFGQQYIPNYWRLEYITGWDKIPADLMDFVAKIAAINILGILGDILYGVGFSSISISLDGVSQNTPLTRSGAAGMFGARQKLYIDELNLMMPDLKYKYRGITFEVL
jgi:hypothetical protein